MSKEEIRIKWIRHKPLIKLDECVDNAMQEYADQQTKALTDEIEELKRINSNLEARVKSWDKMYKTLLQENLDLQSRISELEKVNDSLKEAFKRGSELNDKLKFD